MIKFTTLSMEPKFLDEQIPIDCGTGLFILRSQIMTSSQRKAKTINEHFDHLISNI